MTLNGTDLDWYKDRFKIVVKAKVRNAGAEKLKSAFAMFVNLHGSAKQICNRDEHIRGHFLAEMQVHYSLFGLVWLITFLRLASFFNRLQWKTHHGFDVNLYPKASHTHTHTGSTYSRDQGTMI